MMQNGHFLLAIAYLGFIPLFCLDE